MLPTMVIIFFLHTDAVKTIDTLEGLFYMNSNISSSCPIAKQSVLYFEWILSIFYDFQKRLRKKTELVL